MAVVAPAAPAGVWRKQRSISWKVQK